MLKDVEKNRAAKKEKPTMRRRLEQAGFPKASPKNFWMLCGIVALVTAGVAILFHQKPLVIVLVVFAAGLGLPRWVLGFLTARRKKKFTEHFANAIDVIVRSVKSGLPTNEALRIVARASRAAICPKRSAIWPACCATANACGARSRPCHPKPRPRPGSSARCRWR
jgi:tight adherence protein B